MLVHIHHHPTTLPGAFTADGLVGAKFQPTGDSVEVAQLEVDSAAKPGFDPATGQPVVTVLHSWADTGGRGAVDIMATNTGVVAWVSAVDCQDTRHTVELPLTAGESRAFGYVTLVVDEPAG